MKFRNPFFSQFRVIKIFALQTYLHTYLHRDRASYRVARQRLKMQFPVKQDQTTTTPVADRWAGAVMWKLVEIQRCNRPTERPREGRKKEPLYQPTDGHSQLYRGALSHLKRETLIPSSGLKQGDTWQSSRGRLGRSSNAKAARNSTRPSRSIRCDVSIVEQIRYQSTDRPTDTASYRAPKKLLI